MKSKEEKRKKKVVVFFSGGLDSTYLIWKNLTEGNTVIPVYIETTNNSNKSIVEKNRTKLLWDLFVKNFKLNESYYHRGVQKIFSIGVDANESSLYFKQMPIWILGALFSQGFDADEIQIGYVMNDDAISYLKNIKNIYNSYQPISDKLIPITFPLKKKAKFQMAGELPKEYFQHIISCENPKIIGSETVERIEYEPCCRCTACEHIIAGNYYNSRYFPENYKKNLIEQKKSELYDLGYVIRDKEGNEINYRWETPYDTFAMPTGTQLELDLFGYNAKVYDDQPTDKYEEKDDEKPVYATGDVIKSSGIVKNDIVVSKSSIELLKKCDSE